MQPIYASVVVNFAVGIVLLLAWRYDRSQPFTRWIGLSFLVNTLWLPGYLLYFQGPVWSILGSVLWSAQQALCIIFLAMGVSQMQNVVYSRGQLLAGSALLFATLFYSTFLGAMEAATLSAGVFSLVVALVARYLFRGEGAEKVAGGLLVLNAMVWWIMPVWGAEALFIQSQVVAAARLFLGLALVFACLRRSALAARRLNSQFTKLTEGSHQGVLVLLEDKLAYTNTALRKIFHLEGEEAFPSTWGDWSMSAVDQLMNEGRRARLLKGEVASETWSQPWRLRDGAELHLRFSAWPIDWQGRTALQVVISDETEIRASAQRLLHEATHDRVTGMLNRLGMQELFQQLQAGQPRAGGSRALMVVNIDDFSSINDALGYLFGDEFLQLVSQRLSSVLTPQDVLARVSGDEFLILHPRSDDRSDTMALAESLLAVLRQPFHVHEVTLNVSGSVGVAFHPEDGASFEALLGHANLALRHARQAGRNAVRPFDNAMDAHLREDVALANEMRDALRLGQFSLHLQPILDIRSRALVGAEALLRWQRPGHGFVSPARFIPIAEKTGAIIEIGAWVIEEACRILRQWQAAPDLAPLVLSINVSAMQFARGDVDRVVAQALERHGPPHQQLELEVTESALIHEPEQFVGLLGRLRELGVRLAIDDFGTGYSNLSYLQRFKVDKLKIDQSFVQRLDHSPEDRAIVRAVIQMAASLGLKTTAEGIEAQPTLDMLSALGCDQAQGYLISRPLAQDDFERWCRQERAVPP